MHFAKIALLWGCDAAPFRFKLCKAAACICDRLLVSYMSFDAIVEPVVLSKIHITGIGKSKTYSRHILRHNASSHYI